jgi:hypothetical protein
LTHAFRQSVKQLLIHWYHSAEQRT